jgi:hypothetical protein
MLVTTEWVAAHLDDPGLVVAESDEDVLLYETGHIPGAVKLDWHTESRTRSPATMSMGLPDEVGVYTQSRSPVRVSQPTTHDPDLHARHQLHPRTGRPGRTERTWYDAMDLTDRQLRHGQTTVKRSSRPSRRSA